MNNRPAFTALAFSLVSLFAFGCASPKPEPKRERKIAHHVVRKPAFTGQYYFPEQVDVPFKARVRQQPSFDKELHKEITELHKSGELVIAFIVAADGTPQQLQVISSSDARYNDACVAALEKWTFHPAQKNGKAVAVVTLQQFSWSNATGPDMKRLLKDLIEADPSIEKLLDIPAHSTGSVNAPSQS